MAVLETLDYDMLDVVTEGPHVPMLQPMKDGVASGEKKRTPKHDYTAEDKRYVIWTKRLVLLQEILYPMTSITWCKTVNPPRR